MEKGMGITDMQGVDEKTVDETIKLGLIYQYMQNIGALSDEYICASILNGRLGCEASIFDGKEGILDSCVMLAYLIKKLINESGVSQQEILIDIIGIIAEIDAKEEREKKGETEK